MCDWIDPISSSSVFTRSRVSAIAANIEMDVEVHSSACREAREARSAAFILQFVASLFVSLAIDSMLPKRWRADEMTSLRPMLSRSESFDASIRGHGDHLDHEKFLLAFYNRPD